MISHISLRPSAGKLAGLILTSYNKRREQRPSARHNHIADIRAVDPSIYLEIHQQIAVHRVEVTLHFLRLVPLVLGVLLLVR